ncbi:MAG TPA: hypothetical protein PLR65_05165 [Anaerolineales bacterium]|nr:hypothetical protein [Anaerolineales bacterium]
MSEFVKVQPKCYFITPEHAASFWGRYNIFLYSGQGKLKLSDEFLDFESKALSLHIPLQAITKIGVKMFSPWAKPFGLSYIVIQFSENGYERTISLVPAESAFAPSWKTSKLVEEWFTALSQVDGMSSRLELPIPEINPPTPLQIALFFLFIFGILMLVLLVELAILG